MALLVAAGTLAPVAGPGAPMACAADSTSVAVVVDFSDVASTTATCVPASSRDSGAVVLAARARLLGRPAPRYSASGLLCAIDGYPADGCGVRSSGRYAYWAYSLGTEAGWTYANGGPAGRRVDRDTTEGWRWHPAGSGTATDPPPRAGADPASTCTPLPTTVTTRAPTPTTAATTDAIAERSGNGAGEPRIPPAPEPPTPALTGPTPSSDRPVRAPGSTSAGRDTGDRAAPAPPPPVVGTSSRSNSPIGIVVGGGLLVAISATGFVVSRRRRRT